MHSMVVGTKIRRYHLKVGGMCKKKIKKIRETNELLCNVRKV